MTTEKVLTARTLEVTQRLREAGIRFTITSSRPPRALRKIVDALELTAPLAAVNGALFLQPDFSIIRQNLLSAAVTTRVVELLESHNLEVWVYTVSDWLVRAPRSAQVDKETKTLGFAPVVVETFETALDETAKIVGVSDNLDALTRAESEVWRELSGQVYAARSNPYYLDVTHPNANKGAVIDQFSNMLGVPTAEIATIGDMPVDVPMFERSGGIAMGNASEAVQRAARFVTTSNDDEGFANAVEQYVLDARAVEPPPEQTVQSKE